MTFLETRIPGCLEIVPLCFQDKRGRFVKTYHEQTFESHGCCIDWKEEFYSVSRRGVLRGLHFQLPPHQHDKLVYCTAGTLLDAVVDLRKGSPTYGDHILLELSAEKGNMLYIPRGLAHGFYVTSESATMMYKVSSVYAPDHDAGIRWDSAGIAWPASTPIITTKDGILPPLINFTSPFPFDDCAKRQ